MDIKVLGDLTVERDGEPITPVGGSPGQVLALLASLANRVVPIDVLLDELWPDKRPAHARSVLDAYVNELREVISAVRRRRPAGHAPAPREVLADHRGGYRLDIGAGTVDAWQFERAVGAGCRAMETQDFATASRRLRQGLALWQAQPFTGVNIGRHLARHVAELERARQRAVDQWVEAELRLGRYRQLVSELVALPPRTSFADDLATVLQQCEDERQALAAFQQWRRERRVHRSSLLTRDSWRPPVEEAAGARGIV
ncbi:BTAD domain-containing putative transcriptional regulator [Streptomyces sp. NPDC095613]|uniref:AfsR/SARP family transcriptional regulator n=1 Tax=Streptomyces sp. NPDC095613 TaxID=3155540 RepID=UPI00332E4948